MAILSVAQCFSFTHKMANDEQLPQTVMPHCLFHFEEILFYITYCQNT